MTDIAGEQTLESMSQATWYNQWLLGLFSQHLKGQILEAGCGIGNFTKLLLPFGQVTAVDYIPEYVQKVKKELGRQADIGLGDIEKGQFFFSDKKFDSIISLNVIEHIKDDDKAFANIYKLLNTGGVFVLIVPSNPSLYGAIDQSLGHFRRYDKQQLKRQLEDKGFLVKKIYRLNLLGGLGWWYAGKVSKDTIVRSDRIKVFNLLGPFFLFLERFYEPPVGTSVFVIAQKP